MDQHGTSREEAGIAGQEIGGTGVEVALPAQAFVAEQDPRGRGHAGDLARQGRRPAVGGRQRGELLVEGGQVVGGEARVQQVAYRGHHRAEAVADGPQRGGQQALALGQPAHEDLERDPTARRRLAGTVQHPGGQTKEGMDRDPGRGPPPPPHPGGREVLRQARGRHHHEDGLAKQPGGATGLFGPGIEPIQHLRLGLARTAGDDQRVALQ